MKDADARSSRGMIGKLNDRSIIFILDALSLLLSLLRFSNRDIFLAGLYLWKTHGPLGSLVRLGSSITCWMLVFGVLTHQDDPIFLV
jgi:hypothetical protein